MPPATWSSATDGVQDLILFQMQTHLIQQLEQAETKAQPLQWALGALQNCGNSVLLSLAEAALIPGTVRDDTTLEYK